MNKYDLIHYQNQSDETDISLLKEDMITFSVLVLILQNACADIYTNHESIIICHSCDPYPVWVWCKDTDNIEDVRKIAECLKEALPLENGYTYNIGYGLLSRLKEVDSYFECADIKMNLLSYKLDKIKTVEYPCDGTMAPADTSELELLSEIWHDLCLEMEGCDHNWEFCKNRVMRHIQEKTLFTWKNTDGEIVAVTAKNSTQGYGKVSAVYTLPQYRRKGYAINLVEQITKTILNDNLVPILYTNADYKASNECYKKIGYKEVGSLCTACKR